MVLRFSCILCYLGVKTASQSCAGAGVAAVCTVGVGRSLAEGSESGGGGTVPSTDVTEAGNDRGPHWQDAGGPPSPARPSAGSPDAAQPLQGGPSEALARSPWAKSLPGSRMPWQRLSSEACSRAGPRVGLQAPALPWVHVDC